MGKNKSKAKSGVGTFFFGSFIGFILCLGLIVGALLFAYYKVSPHWLNKTFKTNIDIGSDEANKKTISDFVKGINGLIQNKDSYKLSDLKQDFGFDVEDDLFGIDISDLKSVAISDLSEAVENKFANISADELRNVSGMGLQEDMGNILEQTNTYYYCSTEGSEGLYKTYDTGTYADKVTFDYSLNAEKTKIITKGHESIIGANGVVKIQLWYLPLTDALGDFTSNMGENVTLYDLEQTYGVTLPKFIKLTEEEKKDTTINELEGVINDSSISDILNLNIKFDGSIYYNDINNNNVKDAGENKVSYVLKSISDNGTTVDGLSGFVNGLKVSDIFSETERSSGVLSLIGADTTVEEIPDEIQEAIKGATIETLLRQGIISVSSSSKTKLETPFNHDNDAETDDITLQSFTVTEFIDYALNKIIP